MIKGKKKGFTIVELVIVIAVIGVLAAVLIPVFTGLVAKANLANDNTLVRNLNTQLAASEVLHGKNPTMYDALKDAEEAGYLVANINAKSDNELVWDETLDRFALIDKAGNVISGEVKAASKTKLWKISKNVETDYSTYYIGTETEIETSMGFDAGTTTGITSIEYKNETENAKNVVIRTNGEGTKLTVNAPLDTVHHYDYLDELTVTAVDPNNSYHEHGTVRGKAIISQGHFEIANGGNVSQVLVKNVPTGKTVKVTANESTIVNVDSVSAGKTSVVANSEDVYVAGLTTEKISGSKASDVELPTLVTTEQELATAISSQKAFIQLGANFATENGYVVDFETVIDFAGHMITSSLIKAPFITNNSKLVFVDTASNGGITSSNNNIVINNNDMIINDGKFVSNRAYTVTESTEEGRESRGVINNAVNGNMIINNINVYVKADFGVLNFGDMIINNGKFVSESESGAFTDSRWAYCVTQYGNGNLTINNATINAVHGCIGINGGKATINNATATVDKTKNSYYAIYIAGEIGYPEVVINGGTYTGKTQSLYVGNKSDGGAGNLAMATVNGGTFNGNISVVTTSANNYGIGSLRINAGRFGVNVKQKGINGVETCRLVDGYWVVNE